MRAGAFRLDQRPPAVQQQPDRDYRFLRWHRQVVDTTQLGALRPLGHRIPYRLRPVLVVVVRVSRFPLTLADIIFLVESRTG